MESNNLKSSLNKKKKGGKLKIVLIFIILILIAVIGLLSWLLFSGKNFTTMFNNVEQSEEKSKDKNIDSNDQKDETSDNQKDEQKHDDKISSKTQNNTQNNTNLKDSFKVSYETRGVRNITIGGASFVCNEDVPKISGISSSAAQKMEKYLADWYSRVWEDINKQTEDEYIKEILTQMNEYSVNNDYGIQDIGFHQSYEVIYLTDKIVTFGYIFEGGLGGVSWGNTSGVSFDLETGDVIEIKNIVKSKEKYIEACKKYVYDELKKDSRYQEVLEMHGNDYQSIIDSAIEQLNGYFVKGGIVCVEIPKYEIASGASGQFDFKVPYSLVKDLVDSKYIEQ